jgi:ankyrin repeat protein
MPTIRKCFRRAVWLVVVLMSACTQPRPQDAAVDAGVAQRESVSAPQIATEGQPEAGRSIAPVAAAVDAQTPPPVPSNCASFEGPFTGLSRAAFEGNVDDVRAALARVPPDDRLDACHPTPLIEALAPFIGEPNASARKERERSLRKLRIARLLLDAGADVRASDRNGMSVLHHAVLAYFPEEPTSELVRRVIASGADINAKTTSGVTPLLMAVDRRRASIVRILVEAGADRDAAAATGDTPRSVAERLGDTEIAHLLRQ